MLRNTKCKKQTAAAGITFTEKHGVLPETPEFAEYINMLAFLTGAVFLFMGLAVINIHLICFCF